MTLEPSLTAPVPLSLARRRLLERRLASKDVGGHDLIAVSLRRLQVTHVYGVSGTPIHETLAACVRAGLRVIGARHQQAAAFMAAAQNYVAGALRGAAIVSASPAVTNTATSLLVAKDNCWPLVVLGGRRALRSRGTGRFQDFDAVPALAPLCKWATLVETADELPAQLERAVRIAGSGRPGPVYLDIAEEVLNGSAPPPRAPFCPPASLPDPPAAELDRAAALLLQSERPAVLFGKGLRWSDAYEVLRALVEELDMPFVASPMGRGLLPDDHPLAFTSLGNRVQAEADLILVVSGRINWQFGYGGHFSRRAKVVVIDAHAEEIGVNVVPDVGLVGDAKRILTGLLERVRGGAPAPRRPREEWLAALGARRAQRSLELVAPPDEEGQTLSMERAMRALRDFLPRDAITVLDGHLCLLAAQATIPSVTPLSRLTVGTNGCLGVGIPYAVGAKLAAPERMVVVISGDCAFGFSAMEFETAVRHRVPILVIVVDNQGIWGAQIQRAHYLPEHEQVCMYGADLRYDLVAHALGAHAELVERPEELRPALERAAASGRPACIHLRVDPMSRITESAEF